MEVLASELAHPAGRDGRKRKEDQLEFHYATLWEAFSDAIGDREQVCRYGGEEFCLLLWGASPERAMEIGEEIRARVAESGMTDLSSGESSSMMDFLVSYNIKLCHDRGNVNFGGRDFQNTYGRGATISDVCIIRGTPGLGR